MRVVFDTNVLLSATFIPGVCEVLLDLCLTSDVTVVIISDHILDEFRRHAIGKFHSPSATVEAVISEFRLRCELVKPTIVPSEAFSDPDDLPVLGTATAGRADALVTGDQKLIQLKLYAGVAILSPRTFYDSIRH